MSLAEITRISFLRIVNTTSNLRAADVLPIARYRLSRIECPASLRKSSGS